jgi:hypothetical protein
VQGQLEVVGENARVAAEPLQHALLLVAFGARHGVG